MLVMTTLPAALETPLPEAGQAVSLFGLVAGLLGILLVIALLLLIITRRLRRDAPGPSPRTTSKPQTDPWQESARRLETPEDEGGDEGLDDKDRLDRDR